MKKILFATTALVATGGMAAAEVTFGGYGRFGIGYREDRTETVGGVVEERDDTIIVSRLRLNIDASTESDAGIRFSARFRMQADENASNGEANSGSINGARFSASYGGLRMDVGNAAGALDNLPNYYGNEPGLENFVGQYSGADYSFMGYSSTGSGSNGVYVRYAAGGFAVAASYDPTPDDNDRFDIHGAYTFDNITVALGYGTTDNSTDDDMIVLTVGGDFGPLNATLMIGDEDVGGDDSISGTFYGFSLAYDVSAATTVNFSYGDGSEDGDTEQYGIGVIHSLGGGVTLRGGVGVSDSGGDEQTRADFGVRFNF